jgi:alkanesulfonate monooxygenase SsuD/methylene tetrahydromethanopterin reductase-like flavin-dependent oxidoreductase (luciferase family)
MPDYGHDLIFGTFITPQAAAADRVVALARLTDAVGLDLVTVQDHPYQPQFLEAWTLLSVIAASTQSVRVVPNVANLPLRPPAVLARAAASLDLLSNGRVELGLGTGAFWDAIAANGGPRRTPGEAVTALEEAIAVIRGLWADGGAVRVDGEHYSVVGAKAGPAPAHPIGIWLGAYKPRMLAVTGRLADGWLPSLGYAAPDTLADMNARIDEAAEAAGRTPQDVRRLYNVHGRFSLQGNGFLSGPAEQWAEDLAELTLTQGMSGFVLGSDDADDIQRFAAEVVPAVRELVAAERTRVQQPDADAPVDLGGPVAPAVPAGAADDAPVWPAGLAVTPTPDDGTRRSAVRPWDETTRPVVAAPDPDRRYTAHEQAAGQHLVDVHDHLRSELRQVQGLVEQVAAGTLDAGAARSHINAMTMRQNSWTVGAYCASYCRVVTVHHTLEDESVFPHLLRAEPRLTPVLDRLAEEHLAIHGVLERVDQALVAFVAPGSTGTAALREAVDLLSDTLLSHLSYEEHQLVEPLARHGFY